MALKHILIIVYAVSVVCGENEQTNATHVNESLESFRGAREGVSYFGLVSCAMKYDVNCFLDAAEDFVDNRRTELLAEADSAQSSSRSDPENRPSHLAGTLNRLVSELSNMFTNGLTGFFETGREAYDDNDLTDDDLNDTTTSDFTGELRKLTSTRKKKKKPLKNLIKLIKVAIIAIIIVLKLTVLLKVLQTAMQFKFLIISVGTFAIQAVKLWMNIRSKKDHGHEEIVYKNPYSNGDEYTGASNSPYREEYSAARSAQELAYSLQKSV